MDWPNLRKYELENKNIPINEDEKRIVFMGDSITEFWKERDSDFFNSNSYINRGISGQTTSQMLLRFRQDVIELKPYAVIILAGINDIAENTGPISIENSFGNIVSMVELAKSNNIKIILSSILPADRFPWRPDIKPVEKITQFNKMLLQYAKENNLIYIDYYSEMVDSEKGLDKKFTKDRVHPNLAGYKIMRPLVEEAIEKAKNN